MIGLLDYGMGNIGSIANMIRKVGGQSKIVSKEADLRACNKAILPGVGAFDTAIQHLKQQGLWDALHQFALVDKKPILGVCLGMQLLCKGSEEGQLPGFGWINAEVKRFRFAADSALKVPHMGWNIVKPMDHLFPLCKNWEDEMRFYFVHSYAVRCNDPSQSKGKTHYGYDFDAMVGHENIMGIQCHPEKSHRFGKIVYKNFVDL